ncbi:MAG: UDP-N-acetylmuramate dehydrogenase [Planctomycetota bacterium]|nr:UDP-N-acetylmuramate dehydrogenase [Planctomycetota bacterium]
MSSIEDFSDIIRRDEPLAEYTWLKVGGPAQYFIEPRDPDELARVVQCCHANQIPVRMLGGGSNLLVRDEGVGGAVIRANGEAHAEITVDGNTIRCGAGALLSNLVSSSVRAGLAGMETLVGIPGTVGGALHGNAGGRNGDIGQFVKSVTVLTASGEQCTRMEDELTFAYRFSSIDDLCILDATFALPDGDPNEIVQRMRKLWIMKKATQPLSFQSAGCMFKNPRGLSAGDLIEQAGLKGTRIGAAEISDRHANFVVTHEGISSADVLRLIDLAKSKASEQFGVDLEVEIEVW